MPPPVNSVSSRGLGPFIFNANRGSYDPDNRNHNTMDEIIEQYAEILYGTRHQERADAWMRILGIILQFDYEPELVKLNMIVSSDTNSTDVIDQTEDLILRCAESIGRRMQITFDTDVCFRYPASLASVLEALTGGLEEFEDYQTLLAIANSGEPIQYVLENMIRYMDGTDKFEVDGIIINVSPTLLTVLITHFEARAAEDDYEATENPILLLLGRYAKRFPVNPEITTFIHAPDTIDPKVLADDLEMPEDEAAYTEMLTVYGVGLSILGNLEYDMAYAALEERMGWLNGLDVDLTVPLRKAAVALREIYPEEDEVDE